jgi:hypothetical protein
VPTVALKMAYAFSLKSAASGFLAHRARQKLPADMPIKAIMTITSELMAIERVGFPINIGNYPAGTPISLHFLQKPYPSQKRFALAWRRGKKTPKIV